MGGEGGGQNGWKVPSKSPDNKPQLATTHRGAGSRDGRGRESSAGGCPPPLTLFSLHTHTRVLLSAGEWYERPLLGTWRKQVPQASLFPQKQPKGEEKKWRDKCDWTEGRDSWAERSALTRGSKSREERGCRRTVQKICTL